MSRNTGNPLGSREFLNEAKKFTKKDFSKLTKQEIELLSMGFAMFTDGGPEIDARNIHFVTPQGLKQTLRGLEKEKRGLAPQGKKLLDSIMKKTKPLVEQFGGEREEEKQRLMRMAKQKMSQMGMGQTKTSPLETGQPGAVSTEFSWNDLAGAVRKPQGGQPPMPPMGMPKPPMGGQPPMGMPKPPMGGQPPMPNMDDQPGLPQRPSQPQPGGPPSQPNAGPPAQETEGPRAMEPSPEFAKRMGIEPVERHHLRPKEDDFSMKNNEAGPAMPGMPQGGMPRSMGPVPGEPVRPEMMGQPAAPTEVPQMAPGTTEGSQEFIMKYAGQIKSVLKRILSDEEKKFAIGADLSGMPKNFKESANPINEQYGPGGDMTADEIWTEILLPQTLRYAQDSSLPYNSAFDWNGDGQITLADLTDAIQLWQQGLAPMFATQYLQMMAQLDAKTGQRVGAEAPMNPLGTKAGSRPTQTPSPDISMKEQASNAVGGGMSPVMGNEGEIEGRDKMLGKTGDKRDKFSMMRRASDAIDIMSQRSY